MLHALRQRRLAPALAAILRAEYFAVASSNVNLLRIAVMQAHRHQRAMRLYFVETLPGLADIAAAVERAVFGCCRNAQTGVKRARILRRHVDVATVGTRRDPIDPHVFPGFALIFAAEQAHPHRKNDAVGIGGAHADGVTVEHAFGFGIADDLAAQTRFIDRHFDQMLAAVAPDFATVHRTHHATDFKRGENFVRPVRVPRKAHHPDREWRLAAIRKSWIGLAGPGLAGIVAAIDRNRRAAGEHAFRIGRIRQKRPDLDAAIGKVRALECRAAIDTAIDAILGASKNEARIVRMHEYRINLGLGENMLPVVAAHIAAEHAGEIALITAVIAANAGEHMRLSHRDPPKIYFAK